MAMNAYRFQLLRLAPSSISEEFFNIAVVLKDSAGRVIDARFTPDYTRMACHPLLDMDYLVRLRDEFEEMRLSGEGFTEYFREICRHLSNSLTVSPEQTRFSDDPLREMDLLAAAYLTTPPALAEDSPQRAPAAGSRHAVLRRMKQTFEELNLFRSGDGVRAGIEVPYFGDDATFRFDYGYRPASGGDRYLQALGSRSAEETASRLCFVTDRLRAETSEGAREVTAVCAEEFPETSLKLLSSSRIETVSVAAIASLGKRIREDLGW